MKNKRGRTIIERLIEDLDYAENIHDTEHRKMLAHKALGAADLAVEFGLITYNEWEKYISKIFAIS